MDRLCSSRDGIDIIYSACILFSIQLLHDECLSGIPLNPWQIVLCRVAWNSCPCYASIIHIGDPDSRRRRRLTSGRIFYRNDLRVDGISVVDHVEVANACSIDLPEREVATIRTPLNAIATREFLFV